MRTDRRLVTAIALVCIVAGACATSKDAGVTTSRGSGTTTTSVTPGSRAAGSSSATTPCASTSTTSPGGAGAKETNPPGDIPDNQAFVAYSPPSGEYTVKVPEGWARTDAEKQVSFTDKFNRVDIALRSTAQAPTVDSARTDELPSVQATAQCFELVNVETVTRKAGSAVRIVYRADSPPDPVTGKVVRDDIERYEFWKAGTEAVLTLSGASGSDNVDPWRLVTDSFSWR